jgi:CRP/FNR family transcriptional regulator, cyclic AMP receptor protein
MDEKRLRSVPFFSGLDKKEIRTVARLADEIDIPEGQRLAREGEFAHEFFVIEEGTAEVVHDGEPIAKLGPGDFFGEIGILASERRMATVTSTSPMELIVLTSGALRTVRREHPEVAERLRKAIDERFATAF